MDRKSGVVTIIVNVINELLDRHDVKPTDDLVNDLHMDSLGILDFVLHVETEFDINVVDDECFGPAANTLKVRNAEEWADYVISKQSHVPA
jgi:acyl carrier protein